MKTDEITKNPATPETQPICQKNCRVCNSNYLKEIHSLRKAGRHFFEIVLCMKKKYNYDLSTSGLCRHFKNYNNQKQILAAELINSEKVEEATEVARHTTAIIGLIDDALKQIKENGIRFDVSDLDKLFKIRHQILSGNASNDGELVALFQRAIDNHGVDVNQGILFKSSGRPNP